MQNVLEMSKKFADAYNILTIKVEEAADVESGLYIAETALDNRRSEILRATEPKELGTNEAQREAKLAHLCVRELLEVQRFEQERIGVRSEVEQARLTVDLLKAQLRLMELGAGIRAAA